MGLNDACTFVLLRDRVRAVRSVWVIDGIVRKLCDRSLGCYLNCKWSDERRVSRKRTV
jgi:hypothetical protein